MLLPLVSKMHRLKFQYKIPQFFVLFCFFMLSSMLCIFFSLWWSTRVYGHKNAATHTIFYVMKHLGWKPGNIQVLYCVNKINRSYSVVFIAYTKSEMEKKCEVIFWLCFIFTLFIWVMHFNCWKYYVCDQ